MRKIGVVLLTIISLAGPLKGGEYVLPSVTLGENAEITMLTCSPGQELYSVFGHSAIRVRDQEQNLDWVFNYGTFDFADPNFYVNFVKGRLNYILSVVDYRYFQHEYMLEGRWIYEQKLNIDNRQKQELFDSLVINYNVPEYRYYLYDFFYDNCATRIRDVFTEGIDSEIIFDYSTLEKGQSFRDLLQPYLTEKPWVRLGINLILGNPADKIADPWEYMFLPDHMMEVFEHASFANNNEEIPFTPGSRVILEGREINPNPVLLSPLPVLLFVLLAGILLSYRDLKQKRLSKWFDIAVFTVAGLLGALFIFMWTGTDHYVTSRNYNLLWSQPLHIPLVFLLLYSSKAIKLKFYYFSINAILTLLVILFWFIMPQDLPVVILPFMLTLILRSSVIALTYYKKPERVPVT